MRKQSVTTFMLLLFSALTTLAVSGCGGGDDTPEAPPAVVPSPSPSEPSTEPSAETFLVLGQNSLFFEKDGGERQVGIDTNAPGWTAESNQPWCSAKQSRSDLLTVTVGANTDNQLRAATIIVKTSDNKVQRTITVSQSYISDGNYIRPARASITIPFNGTHGIEFVETISEETIHVDTNLTGWTCRADQSWCAVRCDQSNVYILVMTYLGTEERHAVITLSYNGIDYAFINVVQEVEKKVELTGNDYDYGEGVDWD